MPTEHSFTTTLEDPFVTAPLEVRVEFTYTDADPGSNDPERPSPPTDAECDVNCIHYDGPFGEITLYDFALLTQDYVLAAQLEVELEARAWEHLESTLNDPEDA